MENKRLVCMEHKDDTNKSRNLSIDVIKIIAMLGVVCWHTTRQYIKLENPSWNIGTVLYRTAVISIPLFFIVSGYLQLGREDMSYSYAFRKIWHIIRYMLIFCGAYWAMSSVLHGVDIRAFVSLLKATFVGGGVFYVFWYLDAMIVLYLAMPFLNFLYRKKDIFIYVTILMLLTQNCVFIYNLTIGGVWS